MRGDYRLLPLVTQIRGQVTVSNDLCVARQLPKAIAVVGRKSTQVSEAADRGHIDDWDVAASLQLLACDVESKSKRSVTAA